MNTLVGLGATASFGVSCVAAALPHLGWRTFFEEPSMLLGESGRGEGSCTCVDTLGVPEPSHGACRIPRSTQASECARVGCVCVCGLHLFGYLGVAGAQLPGVSDVQLCRTVCVRVCPPPAGFVLLGRALEERAKLRASTDMAALQVGCACCPVWVSGTCVSCCCHPACGSSLRHPASRHQASTHERA